MITITVDHNEYRLAGTLSFLETGVGNAAVRIYGGVRPTAAADVPTSAMLVQVSLTKPCGTINAGILTLTQLEDGLITTSGTATWARVVNGDGETSFDCDAGGPIGDWEVKLAQDNLFAGGAARIVSALLG